MVYTVTFNPAIDYVVHTGEMKLGEINRAEREMMFFGGKGINVSVMLERMGIKSVALGFTAGFTGEAIEKGVEALGVGADFIRLNKGNSRINMKIKSGQETELNGQGPDIDSVSLEKLFAKLDRLTEGDTLILAGSIPKSLPADIYENILKRLQGRGIRFVVDATGDLLMNVLKYKPFLVKPNNIELGEMFGVKLEGLADIEKYAKKLQETGAANVLVSMAGDGAFLLDENGRTYSCGVCEGVVKNSVGAGDSMVAGFMASVIMQENWDSAIPVNYRDALIEGTAAGGATAFSDDLGKKKDIDRLRDQLYRQMEKED